MNFVDWLRESTFSSVILCLYSWPHAPQSQSSFVSADFAMTHAISVSGAGPHDSCLHVSVPAARAAISSVFEVLPEAPHARVELREALKRFPAKALRRNAAHLLLVVLAALAPILDTRPDDRHRKLLLLDMWALPALMFASFRKAFLINSVVSFALMSFGLSLQNCL